jgi:hypothetical protein
MSEDSRKGISLRTKRKGRPAISAPKQISGPIQQTGDVPRSTGGKSSFEAPPQRPQASGKVIFKHVLCNLLVTDTFCRLLTSSNGDTLRDLMLYQPTSMEMLHLFRLFPHYRINMLLHQMIVQEALRRRKDLRYLSI